MVITAGSAAIVLPMRASDLSEGAMMLPFRRRPTQPKSPPKPLVSNMPSDLQKEPDMEAKAHVDYNLQPLSVQSLQHYIESQSNDERFKVH